RRVQLAPHFAPGAILCYRIETRTTSNEHTISPVESNEGGGPFKQTTSFVVRLDVLALLQTTQTAVNFVRFRTTFEKSHADSAAGAPGAAPGSLGGSLDDSIDQLEGRSFEFTIGPDGQIASVKGLNEITTNREAAERALSWVTVLSTAGSVPREGVEIGQKWKSDKALAGLPLADVIWRTESSYLRDEPCAAPAGVNDPKDPGPPAQSQESCAVILTHFEISRRGSEHSDATPDEYRRNGLRTSGKWAGSGQSLNSVSLVTGFLVSSSQTATQDMDYEIVSAASGSAIHQVGRTTTQTEISLVASPAQPAP
ncbi:MAG TPA: hypothetical protein VJW93_08385, partial [Candidatus Acidoferrales bacterium]|nr:hypothetical protein [Candidatus Acidoferrales bacterium]